MNLELWLQQIAEYVRVNGNEPSHGKLAKWISNQRRALREGRISAVVLDRYLQQYGLRPDLFTRDNRAVAALKLAEMNLRFIKDHPKIGYAKSSDPNERKVNRWLMNVRRAYREPSDTKSVFHPEYVAIANDLGLDGIFERVYTEPDIVKD